MPSDSRQRYTIDTAFVCEVRMATRPDQNEILRRLPIVVGAVGGSLLFLNRIMTPDLTGAQSRSDALGVLLSALLILTGLLWQRVQAKAPEAVVLVGEEGFDLDKSLPEPVQRELAWASRLLLTNTATRSVVVYSDGTGAVETRDSRA